MLAVKMEKDQNTPFWSFSIVLPFQMNPPSADFQGGDPPCAIAPFKPHGYGAGAEFFRDNQAGLVHSILHRADMHGADHRTSVKSGLPTLGAGSVGSRQCGPVLQCAEASGVQRA
ncbi:hypothetical protein GCM10027038_26570 [Arthrobacter bambusae]